MAKPSLLDFMKVPPPVREEKPAKLPGDVVNLTLRMNRVQWEHVIHLTTAERTKIQRYVMGLIEADFAKRGLRF
jgi:hypothetical protein